MAPGIQLPARVAKRVAGPRPRARPPNAPPPQERPRPPAGATRRTVSARRP